MASQWRLHSVNPDTWLDGERVPGALSARVERSVEGDGRLIDSGSIEVSGEVPAGYYRIVLDRDAGGARERVEVATLLLCGGDGEYGRGGLVTEMEGRSVLYPAHVRMMLDGSYAPSGADGAQYAASLLRQCLAAPVEVEGSFTLNGNVWHAFGDSHLEAAWAVLDAGGFVIQTDGAGRVHVRPRPEIPSLLLDEASASLVMPGVRMSLDLSEVPNRYIAVDGMSRAAAVNEDPNSEVSVASRGYYHDMLDESPAPVDGETLSAYARRRLREESVLMDYRTYTREHVGGVHPFSVVRGSMASSGFDGDMRVVSQSVSLGRDVKVTEKAAREVALWTG